MNQKKNNSKTRISKSIAKEIGDKIGIDWSKVSLDQFKMGLEVELEHGTKLGSKTNVTNDDLVKTGKIALAHLLELPNYYSKLKKIEDDKMNENVFDKNRWQRLAGIINESSYHMAKNDQIARVVGKHVAEMLRELNIDSEDGDIVFDDLYHTIKRYLSSVMTEATSPEMSQDIRAYFGSNDSVDGPYKTIADKQPMGVDKKVNKHLVEIGSPEDRWPAREEEEEARSELGDLSSKYPPAASEYAEELNRKSEGPFKLVTDPEHWEQVGVRTGEELAKYLAVEAYRDIYKDAYGIRPRHMNFDDMSVEQVQLAVDNLIDAIEQENEEDDATWLRDLD